VPQAAAQWRNCGPFRVVVTDQSTWWQEIGEWHAVRHDMVAEMHLDPYAEVTEMPR
jgi:hypothetical protein